MSDNIQSLLQDPQLRQQLENAENAQQATQLIVSMAAKKGYAFTQASVEAAIAQLSNPDELAEDALETVAGGHTPRTAVDHCGSYYC